MVVNICASTMLPPALAQAPAMIDEQTRMVGRDDGQLGHAAERVGRHFGRERADLDRHRMEQFGVRRSAALGSTFSQ